jgi:hypothetical protein
MHAYLNSRLDLEAAPMPGTEDAHTKSGFIKTVVFTLIGALIGALGQYLVSTESNRLELMREARRDAYMSFLDVQVDLDLQTDPVKYAINTPGTRRKLAIYGNKSVVEAVARHWREIYKAPTCCGALPQLTNDVAVYQDMRKDIMPWLEYINDTDMMLLQHLCKMPESGAEVKPCQ